MNAPNHIILDFHDVYTEFYPKILRYTTYMVGEADAEDLTQEIFVKISQGLSDFRGDAKLSTWVYRIASNAALDKMRTPAYRHSDLAVTTEVVEAILDDRNIWTGEKIPVSEWQVVRKELSACVQEYIQRLPENYLTVLVLSDLEGLSNKEIADILGISLNTAKIRLHRAREHLKKDLITNCPSYWVEGNEFLPDFGQIE